MTGTHAGVRDGGRASRGVVAPRPTGFREPRSRALSRERGRSEKRQQLG